MMEELLNSKAVEFGRGEEANRKIGL